MNKQTFLAVLGRQADISLAELISLFSGVEKISPELAEFQFEAEKFPNLGIKIPAEGPKIKDSKSRGSQVKNPELVIPNLRRLGGTQKIARRIDANLPDFVENWLKSSPEGKITLAVSDYTRGANSFRTQGEALKLKKMLAKFGRNVRVLPNKTPIISSATSFHNHMWAPCHLELIKFRKTWYEVLAVQDIDAYAERDQARPARDAKVGMLPPKLAQILINLCGPLPAGARILDPFCGTGVVLQEASLMGYVPYGTDLNERMVEYSQKNLNWLKKEFPATDNLIKDAVLTQGDATTFSWEPPINAVACETFLGQPMSLPPAEIKLKAEKQRCREIIRGFLRNLAEQIDSGTPVVIAVPAWLRPDGHYESLKLLDDIEELRYNVESFKNNLEQNSLLYFRQGQVVAREIIVLRKK